MSAQINDAGHSLDQPLAPSMSSRREVLTWGLAASGLLVGSGVVRLAVARSTQPDDPSALAPFVLESLPESLNGWNVVPNSETHLDSLTTRITGSTSHVIRTYYNEMTGTTLSALILYGPAEPVLPHTPQVCYPASGYRAVGNPEDRTIRINDQLDAQFRVGLFTKPGGRFVIRELVYHSYRLDGVWSPTVGNLSVTRRQAGLFKVQIYRPILMSERITNDEPIESFLRQLLPVIEQKIAASRPTSPSSGGQL